MAYVPLTPTVVFCLVYRTERSNSILVKAAFHTSIRTLVAM
uniref:Uncharacterized protein n=1 Tax=Anguilla anguilla TaxID=7936 RepID=A0A0E9UUE9_ANGAN